MSNACNRFGVFDIGTKAATTEVDETHFPGTFKIRISTLCFLLMPFGIKGDGNKKKLISIKCITIDATLEEIYIRNTRSKKFTRITKRLCKCHPVIHNATIKKVKPVCYGL